LAESRQQESFSEFPLLSPNQNASEPYASHITTGPDGNLWFTQEDLIKDQESTTVKQIGRITPSGSLTLFSVPAFGAFGGIVAGPDSALWFTERENYKIGRISTDGTLNPVVDRTIKPKTTTIGPDGNLWFTQSSNNVGRIVPADPPRPLLAATAPASRSVQGGKTATAFATHTQQQRGNRHGMGYCSTDGGACNIFVPDD
jgi:sugar lactone lactonase YvrE